MAAIMLQGKEADDQGTRRKAEQQGGPYGIMRRPEHERHGDKERNRRCDQLENRTAVAGFAVLAAISRQPSGLLAQLIRKLRAARNIQGNPQGLRLILCYQYSDLARPSSVID